MCQCGCGDLRPSKVFKVGVNKYVVLELYRGCQDCTPTIGASIHFFDKQGFNNYLEHEKVTVAEFGEFGGSSYSHVIFDVKEDLIPASKNHTDENTMEDYESIQDFLHDEGLRIIQEATYNADKRINNRNRQ